jgi:hypothetical protein
MRILIFKITVLVSILSACSSGPTSPYMQQCFNTTEPWSVARINCMDKANSQEQQDRARQQRMAQMQGYASRCDSYGFKRGTNQFAQCLQQAERQQSIDNSIQMQQNELDRQNQERLYQKSQCFFSGRFDC